MPQTQIKIEMTLVSARPPLRALADVTLKILDEQIVLKRCPIFQKDGQPPWASLPSFPLEKNGKRTYVVPIELLGELKKRVLDELIVEYQKKSSDH
jgi:hypothetical protein